MSTRDDVVRVLKRAKRPLSTMEVVGRIYPTATNLTLHQRRSAVYAKLRICEKWGEARAKTVYKGMKKEIYWEWIK